MIEYTIGKMRWNASVVVMTVQWPYSIMMMMTVSMKVLMTYASHHFFPVCHENICEANIFAIFSQYLHPADHDMKPDRSAIIGLRCLIFSLGGQNSDDGIGLLGCSSPHHDFLPWSSSYQMNYFKPKTISYSSFSNYTVILKSSLECFNVVQ